MAAVEADPSGPVAAVTQQQVVVPWKLTSDQHRLDALCWCLHRWVTVGFEVKVAQINDDVWCKAATLAQAVADSQPVFLMADADVWVPNDAVRDAVKAVADGAPWAIPHLKVCRLTQPATAALLADQQLPPAPYEEPPYVGIATGGMVAVRREVAWDCPMDSSFKVWGGEDDAWGKALDTLHGSPYRPPHHADLIHLWHPRLPGTRGGLLAGSPQNEVRRRRYFEAWAAHDDQAIRQLVEEGRVWPTTSPNSCSNMKASERSSRAAEC